MAEEKKNTSFLGHLTSSMDRFSGDKVILLIALFLMLISVVSVFSSTPRLANDTGTDRVTIMVNQLKVVALGFVIIFSLYYLGRVEWYRKLSMLLKAIRNSGLAPGKEVGLICYNDFPLNEFIFGGLTTLSVDFIQMGRLAGEMVLSGALSQVQCQASLIRRNTF